MHVDEHSGLVVNGEVALVGNAPDLVALDVPGVKVGFGQVAVVGLAVVEVVFEPGAVDAVLADHGPGFTIDGHVRTSDHQRVRSIFLTCENDEILIVINRKLQTIIIELITIIQI